ncbi:Ger(x)C family spore germination protein [Paenibacillus gansuensis]|uniref:Ger(X)C family spore germination protein n=1 Tax=Paenibacillus gansuensis TaxID=306542 RepID=A0ABW5PBU6_9BACL
MKAKCILLIFMCSSLLLLPGCWDRTEINNYAFWMGTLLDKGEKKKFRVSAQIAIPKQIASQSKEGGSNRSNIVISAEGNTLLDTCLSIQNKLPRRLFIGHRRSVFISERLAKEGLSQIIDMYTRNAELSLRTGLFVVLGSDPERVLKIESPFNPFSADAIVMQDKYAKIGDVASRDLVVNYSSQGTSPVMSAISLSGMSKEEQNKVVNIDRLAVFNKKLQMVGLLNNEESMVSLWIINRLKIHFLTSYIPEGKGYVTVYETNLKSKITSEMKNGKPIITVHLKGVGSVRENNTDLDLSRSHDLKMVENRMNQYVESVTKDCVRKIQEQFRTDIYGFGETLHREYPQEWKKLKQNWEDHFHKLDVTVKVQTRLKRIGVYGPRPHQTGH